MTSTNMFFFNNCTTDRQKYGKQSTQVQKFGGTFGKADIFENQVLYQTIYMLMKSPFNASNGRLPKTFITCTKTSCDVIYPQTHEHFYA